MGNGNIPGLTSSWTYPRRGPGKEVLESECICLPLQRDENSAGPKLEGKSWATGSPPPHPPTLHSASPVPPWVASWEPRLRNQVSPVWSGGTVHQQRLWVGGEEFQAYMGMEGLRNPDPDFRLEAEFCIFQRTSLELIVSLHFYPERQALFTPNSKIQKLRPREVT